MESSSPKLRGFAVPVKADSVDSPIVSYGDGMPSINFPTAEGRWGRVTFEKLDSIRVSRGEHDPYPSEVEDGNWEWVSILAPSPWLQERYAYAKRHYGTCYEFGGDVDEMLREYSHYVFSFHDEFVEAICSGIWFETADEFIGNRLLAENHPLADLPVLDPLERFEAHGITCQLRRNARPLNEIVKDAELCSQKLFQFAAELDGSASVSWTVTLRVHDGRTRSYLRSYFGKAEETYDGVVSLDAVRPRVESWLEQVRQRRREMGKE